MTILGYQLFYWSLIAGGFHFFDWWGLGFGFFVLWIMNAGLHRDDLAIFQLLSGLLAVFTACAWPELLGLLKDALQTEWGVTVSLPPTPTAYLLFSAAGATWIALNNTVFKRYPEYV